MKPQEPMTSPAEFDRRVDAHIESEINRTTEIYEYRNAHSIAKKLQYIYKFRSRQKKRPSDIARIIGLIAFYFGAFPIFANNCERFSQYLDAVVPAAILFLVITVISKPLGMLNDSWLKHTVSKEKIEKMRKKKSRTATMYLPDFGRRYCTLWIPFFTSILYLLYGITGRPEFNGISCLTSIIVIICYSVAKKLDIPYAQAYLSDQQLLEGEYKKQEAQKASLEDIIRKIRDEGEAEKKKYREAFDKTVSDVSVQFAGSDAVQRFVEWIRPSIEKAITQADRRPHIEIIKAPVTFTVFADRITAPNGKYEFAVERLTNLKDFSEQAGLARAAASALQLDIMERHPSDICGTFPTVRLQFDYGTDNGAAATVIYEAPNANYQPEAEWTDNHQA